MKDTRKLWNIRTHAQPKPNKNMGVKFTVLDKSAVESIAP